MYNDHEEMMTSLKITKQQGTHADNSERVGFAFVGAVNDVPFISGISKSNVSPVGTGSDG